MFLKNKISIQVVLVAISSILLGMLASAISQKIFNNQFTWESIGLLVTLSVLVLYSIKLSESNDVDKGRINSFQETELKKTRFEAKGIGIRTNQFRADESDISIDTTPNDANNPDS